MSCFSVWNLLELDTAPYNISTSKSSTFSAATVGPFIREGDV